MYQKLRKVSLVWTVAVVIGLISAFAPALAAFAEDTAPQTDIPQYSDDDLFAKINGEIVTFARFNLHVKIKMRSELYHGGSPERMLQFQRSVADELIVRTLLLQEADRREIAADSETIDGQLGKIEEAYKGSETWERAQRELPILRLKLLGDTQLEVLEAQVKEVTEPTEGQLKDYYNQNIDKFTQPEKFGLSVILIRVDPSSANSVWEAARSQVDSLYQSLNEGADFAEFAREISDHETAGEDGALPFIHLSQLSLPAQEVVKDLDIGAVSKPAKVMEGYILFKLNEKQPSVVHPLDQVRDNALGLYRTDTAKEQYDGLIAALRNGAEIEVGEQASELVTS